MTKQRIGCIKRKKTIEFTPLFLNVYVHVFWLFCVTMMALQVNLHLPWTFPFGVLNLKVVLKGGTVLPGTGLVYYSSKIHFEYLTKHEECLIYVAVITVLRLFYCPL